MEDNVTFEGRVRYSKDVLTAIRDLANEDPNGETSLTKIVGSLKLNLGGEYLFVTYTGRRDITKRIENYIEMVNYDGSHEAMMAAFEFKSRRQE